MLGTDAPVVVVEAGAGYGKSTLLSQLVEAEVRAVGWLTLDTSDVDPMVMVRHLVDALSDAGQDLDEVRPVLDWPEPDLWGRVLPLLTAAVERSTTPFLLVLDDVHVITSRESVEQWRPILDVVPEGSTVVLSGRSMPHSDLTRLARRELDGDLVRFDGSDLAFLPQEAHAVVQTELPELRSTQVDQVVRSTEGWPAGVHLAVLALRDRSDPSVLVDELVASDRRVVDYLEQEVLSHLDHGERTFLAEIAVLQHLSGPLCDATTGRQDSAVRLEGLVAGGNLFIAPVAGTTGDYRLHQLFADMLLRELRRRSPERERELRIAAARWLAAHGEPDAAIAQALLGGDLDLAARIAYRNVSTAIHGGTTASLDRWISLFPGDAVASDALLGLVATWSAIARGNRAEALHHLDSVRTSSYVGPLPDGTVGLDVAIAAADLLVGAEGVNATAESAAIVVQAGPTGSPWWHIARLQLAFARALAGTLDPVEGFAAAELDTRGRPAVHAVTSGPSRARPSSCRGSGRGAELSAAAQSEIEASGLASYPLVGLVHCVSSLSAAIRGDVDGSRRHAEDAEGILQLSRAIVVRTHLHTRQVLAEAALVRGDVEEARRLLTESRRRLGEEPDAVLLHRVQGELERRLESRRDERAGLPSVVKLTPAEARVLEELRSHRSLDEIGRRLYISRNTVKTHTVSIYRKVGVSNRSQAVDRADELGLFADR